MLVRIGSFFNLVARRPQPSNHRLKLQLPFGPKMHAYDSSQSSFINSMYRPNSTIQPPNASQSYASYKSQTEYPMAVRFDSHPLHSLSAYNSGSFSFYPCASSHRYVHDLNCGYTSGALHSGKISVNLHFNFN